MQDQYITGRLPLPEFLERNVEQTIELRLYRDGALVAPSAVTVSVFDPNRKAIVDAQAATIADSYATYTISAATTANEAFALGWRIEWTATVSGQVHTYRNDAALVRCKLSPVIEDGDLFRVVSSLDPSGDQAITSRTNFQSYLDEAWCQLILALLNNNLRPSQVMSPYSLRNAHLYGTLALIFEDLSTRLNPAYIERAEAYRAMYKEAFKTIAALMDTNNSGSADDPYHRTASEPTIYLGGRGRSSWRY